MWKKFFNFRTSFSIDLRSLALFRITLGCCLFVDTFIRCFYIEDFYTDQGVLPREALDPAAFKIWHLGFNLLSGTWDWQFTLFMLTMLMSLGMILGSYTRLCTLASLLLLGSIHLRNPTILHSGDALMRVLLFWSLFLPTNAHFSIDRIVNPKKSEESDSFLNVGTIGLVLQICSVYLFAGAAKWDPVWHTEGSAVYYALSSDNFGTMLGRYLLNFPQLLSFLTFSTLTLEFVGPLLILFPLPGAPLRRAWVCGAFIFFHLGLAMTMWLGLFPWVCIAAWIALFPSFFWEKLGKLPFWKQPGTAPLVPNFIKPPAPSLRYSKLSQCLAGFYIFLIFYWNLSFFPDLNIERPKWLAFTINVSELYQRWAMFSPRPSRANGWFVIDSDLANGSKVDPWANDKKVHYDQYVDLPEAFKNVPWRKYLSKIVFKENEKKRFFLARYICQHWNHTHENPGEKIKTLRIFFMLQETPPPGQALSQAKKIRLWRHYCTDKPENWDTFF